METSLLSIEYVPLNCCFLLIFDQNRHTNTAIIGKIRTAATGEKLTTFISGSSRLKLLYPEQRQTYTLNVCQRNSKNVFLAVVVQILPNSKPSVSFVNCMKSDSANADDNLTLGK